jgi:hypothetical protein
MNLFRKSLPLPSPGCSSQPNYCSEDTMACARVPGLEGTFFASVQYYQQYHNFVSSEWKSKSTTDLMLLQRAAAVTCGMWRRVVWCVITFFFSENHQIPPRLTLQLIRRNGVSFQTTVTSKIRHVYIIEKSAFRNMCSANYIAVYLYDIVKFVI